MSTVTTLTKPTKLIRLDLPFWARLQNFIFMPDGSILWTTASQNIWHKIKRLITKKPSMVHTSLGIDIPYHGQWLLLEGNNIIYEVGSYRETYDLKFNLLSTERPGHKLRRFEIYNMEGIIPDLLLQGVDYTDEYIYTVFGRSGHGDITVFKHKNDQYRNLISKVITPFKLYDRWYFKKWESEGLRVHPVTGELWIGMAFATRFAMHYAYITKIEI